MCLNSLKTEQNSTPFFSSHWLGHMFHNRNSLVSVIAVTMQKYFSCCSWLTLCNMLMLSAWLFNFHCLKIYYHASCTIGFYSTIYCRKISIMQICKLVGVWNAHNATLVSLVCLQQLHTLCHIAVAIILSVVLLGGPLNSQTHLVKLWSIVFNKYILRSNLRAINNYAKFLPQSVNLPLKTSSKWHISNKTYL